MVISWLVGLFMGLCIMYVYYMLSSISETKITRELLETKDLLIESFNRENAQIRMAYEYSQANLRYQMQLMSAEEMIAFEEFQVEWEKAPEDWEVLKGVWERYQEKIPKIPLMN